MREWKRRERGEGEERERGGSSESGEMREREW